MIFNSCPRVLGYRIFEILSHGHIIELGVVFDSLASKYSIVAINNKAPAYYLMLHVVQEGVRRS